MAGPPTGSFDPALEAERRSLARGLSDTRFDIHREIKRGRRDFRTTKKDYRVQKRRGMQDFATQLRQGLQQFGYQATDVRTGRERARQDFAISLSNLVHGFNVKAQQQAEAANAAGVLGGSTEQAAAAARAGGFHRAYVPLRVGLARSEEDTATQLGRLRAGKRQLRFQVGRGERRLGQDTHHDIRLARRDFTRNRMDLHTQLQRAIREKKIGSADIFKEEAYQRGLNY